MEYTQVIGILYIFILFYAHARSSEWGLFGHIARSAFRRTPSGRLARSQLESDLTAIKSPQKSLFIVLIQIVERIFGI